MHPANPRTTILIGEDESDIRSYLATSLRCRGYEVRCAADGEEVLKQLSIHNDVDAVLLDIMMPRKDGFGALREIRRTQPNLPVIMLSALGTTNNIVEAIKGGATDFLTKPVSNEDVWRVVDKAVRAQREPSLTPEPAATMFFGEHPAIREIHSLIDRVAQSDLPVLVRGETGTGKEVLARQIHACSPRSSRPFVKLNCAAIPSELIESELFGYEKGAFTGAFQKKAGLLEMAEGGTLLLDEIGDMDVRLQAKLLHVLQDHTFRRIGGKDDLRVEVRFMAATHRDLETSISEGHFRQDLYYRLNCVIFALPPLRERREEIPRLAEFLLSRHARGRGQEPLLTPALLSCLSEYTWPGNIRELESVIRKLVVLQDPDLIIRDVLGRIKPTAEGSSPSASQPVDILTNVNAQRDRAETEAILAALSATRWNRKKAAALLNIDYKALLYKMRKLSIDSPDQPN